MIHKEKWLVAIDLDGTLLNTQEPGSTSNYSFNPKNLEYIQKVKELGHKVAIVTGRPWEDTKPVYEALGLNGIVACFNGAHVHYPGNKEFVPWTFSINLDIVQEVLNEELVKKVANSYVIETLDTTYVAFNSNETILGRINSVGKKNRVDWTVGDRIDSNPQSVLIGIDYDEVDPYEVLHVLRRNYGDALFFRLWDGRKEGYLVLEINQIAANKGTAVEQIAAYYNIPLQNTLAIGDGLNDREMLVKAGRGVAMKNAKGTMKTYANDVTDFTNDEAGVGEYLKYFFELD